MTKYDLNKHYYMAMMFPLNININTIAMWHWFLYNSILINKVKIKWLDENSSDQSHSRTVVCLWLFEWIKWVNDSVAHS